VGGPWNWHEAFALLIAYLGWTPEQIGRQMTMRQFRALVEIWRYDPPVQVSVARALGVEGRPQRITDPDEIVFAIRSFYAGLR